jgi:hypothetical protein
MRELRHEDPFGARWDKGIFPLYFLDYYSSLIRHGASLFGAAALIAIF